jgi:nucleolin
VAFEADEKELLRLFEGYDVTKVRLHTDKETGKSKGFAHIHFK